MFELWIKTKGKNATRKKLLKALREEKCEAVCQKLEEDIQHG